MSINITLEKFFLRLNPLIGMVIAIAAISTASILIRLAQGSYPSLFIAAARLSIACLVLLPFFICKDKRQLRSLRKADFLALAGSGIFLALHFASWIKSLELTDVISSVVLVTTTPIWVSLISFFIHRERLNRIFYFGLSVAMVGVFIISISDLCSYGNTGFVCMNLANQFLSPTALLGNLLALAGAVCAAGYILCGKMVRTKIDNLSYVFLVYLIASLVLLSAVFLTGQSQIEILRPEIGWVILVALIPQLIGHSMINWSLGHLPASYVSLSLLGEPVGSTLLALFFLGELPSLMQFLGSAVIIIGLILATKPAKQDRSV